ncbi:MAG: hypothetical protein AB1671_15650, partial [Thermodesulfobacteriota bacterium]
RLTQPLLYGLKREKERGPSRSAAKVSAGVNTTAKASAAKNLFVLLFVSVSSVIVPPPSSRIVVTECD